MQKKDLITSLSHYNDFNFIHWRVCIQDGTVGYVLDTDPAYERIIESWSEDYDEDDFADFIMEVSASHFDLDDIMSYKHQFEELVENHTTINGTVDDFDFDMWDATYESYYLEDMIDQMIQIRLISQFAKDTFFRITIAMQDQHINSYEHPFDDFSMHILKRFGAWDRALLDYNNLERNTHTVRLGSHHNFLGYDIDQLNAVVDDYVSSQKLDGVAIDIEYNTNEDGILEATFELEN